MNYVIQYNLNTGYMGCFNIESSDEIALETLANRLIIDKEKSNIDAGETLTAEVIVYDESGEQRRYTVVIVLAPNVVVCDQLGHIQVCYYCAMDDGYGFYL